MSKDFYEVSKPSSEVKKMFEQVGVKLSWNLSFKLESNSTKDETKSIKMQILEMFGENFEFEEEFFLKRQEFL